MEKLNIIEFIENNPLTKLSNTYNSVLLSKIKNNFTAYEQQIFLTSLYCYLNYNQKTDFIIDLEDIYKWLGFTQKANAKRLIVKFFKPDIDYKVLFISKEEQKTGSGGYNKETILLTVRAFKLFCIKAETSKASEIHEYFIKLEEVLQEVIEEESNELKNQLKLKDAELSQKDAKFSIDLTRTKEKTLIESNKKKSVVYCGKVNEDFKFGYSDDIERRVRDHKTDFGAEFTLLFVFESPFYMKIEKMIKKELIDKIYSKEFNGQLKVELIKINEKYTESMFYAQIQEYHKHFLSLITIESLSQEIVEKDLILEKVITENNKLVEDNTVFLKENIELKHTIIELSKKIITPSSVQPSQDIIDKLLERRANKAAYQREYCIKNKDKIKEYEIANADRTKATKALYRAKKKSNSSTSSTA